MSLMDSKKDSNRILIPNAKSVTPDETSKFDTPIDGQSDCGSMHINTSELRYVGGDHWAAIMDSFADLKEHFDREEQLQLADATDQVDFESSPSHALLLYGCRRASRNEVIGALPPKDVVDRYLSRYFNYLDLVSSCMSFSWTIRIAR